MEQYESLLKFLGYEVNEIIFKKNDKYKSENEENSKLDLKIKPKTVINENNMDVTLEVLISENAQENNKPFEMKVELTGYFYVEGMAPERLKANAIAILYPYVRAIISTYTTNANITPLLLPAINVNKLVEQQNKEEN